MRNKTAVIANVCIATVLIGLGIAVFTTDLSNVFLTVGAPVYNGDREKQNISLMFIVEEDASHISDITKLLKDNNVEATFFVSGKWASSNPVAVTSLATDFEIGNYGYSSTNLTALKESAQYSEMLNCHNIVKSITAGTPINIQQGNAIVSGIEMNLFTPPSGSFNKTTLKCAEKLKYKTIMWSRDATEGAIKDKATTGTLGGDIVLLKPSKATSDALASILQTYKQQNFNVVKIGNLLD